LASTALHDDDALVRFRAAEAMNFFGRCASPKLREMAERTLNDDNAEVRCRASEALGNFGDRRDVHAQTFSDLCRPSSPCSPTDVIKQNRALAALRDMGTASYQHRNALDCAHQGSRDASVRLSASRALAGLSWRRPVATPVKLPDLHRQLATLRAEADDLRTQTRITTAAGQRTEDFLMLRARSLTVF